ncbi:dethiobiotin synthase [Ampullimonas aquatilis]|uniref:dethiobiotin synthase n=1 Tax=Ampullimonas aquatilis TaxID=1341549 RepID=UPI003C753B46
MHSPSPAWFVTGTDTEIGKTTITAAILHGLVERGYRAVGLKPIAAGLDALNQDGKPDNGDVLQLMAASNVSLPRAIINPYLLAEPVAPHSAAEQAGVYFELAVMDAALQQARAHADIVLVEGVGGFRVPLQDGLDTADWAQHMALPVLLVVGLRLGCINHALLTAEAIAARGLTIAGWIANQVDPQMLRPSASVAAIQAKIAAPLLGVVPYQDKKLDWREQADEISRHLNLAAFLGS